MVPVRRWKLRHDSGLRLLAPPTAVMSPGVAWRVLTRRVPDGQGSPWGAMHRDSVTHARA
ncbi:MAG: hypothetical protein HY048_14630 [Acidobacteria bacterium]|nr:hypothetical protein [Acidobacteriota bacterium]